jgi:serine/threonine-protein kinase RsbT
MQVEADDSMPVRTSEDVVRVRQAVRARAVAAGFSLVDQTKIVTAASEIARNTVDYGGGGTVRIEVLSNGIRRGVRLSTKVVILLLRTTESPESMADHESEIMVWLCSR